VQRSLVIAKYKEDISWLGALKGWEIFVYSKDPNEPDPNLTRLPNVGREAHTYLYHIVKYYDELSELTVFAQANPFDHSPNFVQKLSDLKAGTEYEALSDDEMLFDSFAFPHLAASPLSIDRKTFQEFYLSVLNREPPKLMFCKANALFAVSRERLRSRPKEFYQRILKSLEGETSAELNKRLNVNMIEAHFLERMWHHIFMLPGAASTNPLVDGLTQERMMPILALLAKWPEEIGRVGQLKASTVLMAANEILAQKRS